MNTHDAFRFLDPGVLLLLPVAWWLIWIYARRQRRQSIWHQICDPLLLKHMATATARWDGTRWLALLLATVVTLGILAAAGPSWRKQSHPMMESTSARVVVLDLSRSMLVQDVKPDRFQHAISAAREIIDVEFDGETGLVVFAGAAFVVSPLTNDTSTLLAFIDALDPSTMPEDGSRIDLAIERAQDLLEASVVGSGQILLITAGADQDQAAVQVALSAAGQGHRVSVLAIGTAQGGPVPDTKGGLTLDANGKFVIEKTNFELLDRITRAGNGSLIAMIEAGGYENLLVSKLSANELIETEKLGDSAQRTAANDGAWLVLFILPFALLLFRKNLVWMFLLCILLPAERELHAQERDPFWQHPEHIAFGAYQQGDYESAYQLSSDPFLRGAAYYRSGQYRQALQWFAEDVSAASHYNRGNVLARQGKFTDAVVAYRRALESRPDFAAARYNKRLVELYLEQQYETDSGLSSDTDEAGAGDDEPNQGESETRIGIAGQEETNPGDDPELGSGLGASMQPGQVDPFERFDGLEQEPGRFVLRAQTVDPPDAEFIERWISSLPETSTDLFRRKFLRDYQRRKR